MFDIPNTAISRLPKLKCLCLALLLTGCNGVRSDLMTPAEHAAYVADNEKHDQELTNPVKYVVLSDQALYEDRSGERILTGDVRPLYVAEGRVKSTLLHSNADSVVVKVYLQGKDHEVIDTAEIMVKDIPPQGVKSFRQKIQLLPPRGVKASVIFEIDSVKSSAPKSPWTPSQ